MASLLSPLQAIEVRKCDRALTADAPRHRLQALVSGCEIEEFGPVADLVFLDLETRLTDEDVGGWDHAQDMRVAVAVTFSTETGRFHIFEEEELEFLFEQLSRADLVVGYNIRGFDYRVLSPRSPRPLDSLPTLDLAEDVARAAGHHVKLEALARATLGEAKSGDGADAPRLFREGLMYDLVAYCTRDVEITRDLFRHGAQFGSVAFLGVEGRRDIPVDWRRYGG
jgi:DEAD/DEAH box helicase domain-containing protein